ncbi:MAG: YihY/virulence factor BrkB family protein [Gemmatimonadetes bacterium]|nr:YihY/virulence factor BrkB family protein [Gemmatimonadota bacterium]
MPTPPAPPRRRTAAIVAVEAGQGLRDYALRVWKHSNEDDLLFLASGISFDLLLAIVPFALLIISGLGYFLNKSPDASIKAVLDVVGRFLPTEGVKGGPLESALRDIIRTRGSVGIVSAVTFLWFSTRLFASLRSALDRVFGFMHARRSIVAGKWLDIRITVYTTLLIVAWTALSAYLSINRTFSMPKRGAVTFVGTATYVSGRAFAVLVFVYLFWSLYRYLPSRKLRPRTALVAALWTTGMFELARYLFAAYVLALNPGSLYTSTLRAIVVVMFWIYYAGIIFTFGGEIGRVFELRRAERLGAEPWT